MLKIPAGVVFEDQGVSCILKPELLKVFFSCLLLLRNFVIYKETMEQKQIKENLGAK